MRCGCSTRQIRQGGQAGEVGQIAGRGAGVDACYFIIRAQRNSVSTRRRFLSASSAFWIRPEFFASKASKISSSLASQFYPSHIEAAAVRHKESDRCRIPGAGWIVSAKGWYPVTGTIEPDELLRQLRSRASRIRQPDISSGGGISTHGERENSQARVDAVGATRRTDASAHSRAGGGRELVAAQMTRLPLKGTLVLDFSTLLPGPFATLMLAEAGATVIKVERAGSGDEMRGYDPSRRRQYEFPASQRRKDSIVVGLKAKYAFEAIEAAVSRGPMSSSSSFVPASWIVWALVMKRCARSTPG